MMANGTIIATATRTAAASTSQRRGPRRRRSCDPRGARVRRRAVGPTRSATAVSVVISDPLPAFAGRLDADEDERDDDHDDREHHRDRRPVACLLYTSDAADEEDSVDLGG